ncbi:hypothetical protein ABT052_26120 [Streptomyces sp. NPDC002766]
MAVAAGRDTTDLAADVGVLGAGGRADWDAHASAGLARALGRA